MENVLITVTLEEKESIRGTLELIEVMTEGGIEYDVTYSIYFNEPALSKISKRYNVARIKKKKSAQKFYRKQMKKLIAEGASGYFCCLAVGSI